MMRARSEEYCFLKGAPSQGPALLDDEDAVPSEYEQDRPVLLVRVGLRGVAVAVFQQGFPCESHGCVKYAGTAVSEREVHVELKADLVDVRGDGVHDRDGFFPFVLVQVGKVLEDLSVVAPRFEGYEAVFLEDVEIGRAHV